MADLGRSERSIRPPDINGSHHLEITGNQLERRERFYLFSVVPHESTAVLQNRVGLRASSPFGGKNGTAMMLPNKKTRSLEPTPGSRLSRALEFFLFIVRFTSWSLGSFSRSRRERCLRSLR